MKPSNKQIGMFVLFAGLTIVAVACVFIVATVHSSSDVAQNSKALNQLLKNKADVSEVEKVFGKSIFLSNALEEIRIRSSYSEQKDNLQKAAIYPRVAQYSPVKGEPWDIIVFVFYSEDGQMKDFCIGGQ